MVLSFIFSLFDATVKPPGADKALDVKIYFQMKVLNTFSLTLSRTSLDLHL